MEQVVVITGAATGIGKATVKKFHSEGYTIIGCDINVEQGRQLETEFGKKVIFFELDVTKEIMWENLKNYIIEKNYSIKALFNNAGIFIMNSLEGTTEDEYNQMFDINVKGCFFGLKYIAPILYQQQGGSIINASSNAALFGAKGLGIYGATKGAVRTLTKNAAMEYAPYVRVNSIHPGYIHTQMIEYAAKVSNKEPIDQAKFVPLKRLGNTEEIAELVYYLSSDKASYITGSELVIDGGVAAGQSIWEEEE
ncbi:SDR family NAD(P)-dependent oxidoreductase [Lysinibacillus endophyticus]|mgnify:CR=1 FL=1|uniref:SDR family NAD(P)-dependent oxidoreductase n=1 Tax=Ureibacillus endophyticus TaxID=1978490 RepID=UPI0020A015CB|nr:SDR family oxidoreductase [Lysinibacillus endophyticus]MCP1146651.1 SDR family oxidoreductase [Lysinibacillus endophyticus]